MQYQVKKPLSTEDLDRAAFKIMRRGDLIQYWNMAAELGLKSQTEYASSVRSEPSLHLHIECIRRDWNSIVRQQKCLEIIKYDVRQLRPIYLGYDSFFRATCCSGSYGRAILNDNPLMSRWVTTYNRIARREQGKRKEYVALR